MIEIWEENEEKRNSCPPGTVRLATALFKNIFKIVSSQDKIHIFLPASTAGKCAEEGEFSTGCCSTHLVAARRL